MICSRCGGTGRVRRSFLGLITWTAPCPRCQRMVTFSSFGPNVADDRPWPPGQGAAAPPPPPTGWQAGGGAGGGGGASASWSEAPEGAGADEPPLIVDPFAAGGEQAGGRGAAAGEPSGAGPGAERDDSVDGAGDDDRQADGGEGTSY